ncbi:protein phosphatase 1 regulatory subunit 16A [Patella vulgata]|uniref:protein phosphatase 1 regulatory subunit 16A n=1 Tax=Patella vulgata TaxID=6465 RepID=UPI00218033A6|nr:protein phosphatase 1 regulatory subunit 16A [Patella vulgata]
MVDHHDLVAEMPSVERMSTQDRLKHAKKRRIQQLKKFSQYEKQLEKESSKKRKSGNTPIDHKIHGHKRNVIFVPNISLLEAAARKDVDEVGQLLARGVNPDLTNDDGLTALHQCCIDDSEQMLVLLLEYGANVNAQDSEQWTPLHAAATCGHAHLCKHLVDRGADLLAVNADGNMPYDICEDERTLDYIETEMAKRGITQEEIDDKRLASEKYILEDLEKKADTKKGLEFRDHIGATPLHIAAANGYLKVAEYLLDNHVAVNVKDYDSWQPIHAAAYWGHTIQYIKPMKIKGIFEVQCEA